MLQAMRELLFLHGVKKTAPVRLADCRITRRYLLERVGIESGTVLMLAVPYYTTECDSPARNISAYAVSGDYHVFFKRLFADILPVLREKFPQNRFAGFTDHSPIDERAAAVTSGLGFIGKNHLLLTKEYSSYVFLGEIVTDAALSCPPVASASCMGCGACVAACPVAKNGMECLSALTQKKGALTGEEQAIILQNGSLWGCDRCQEVCPVTLAAREAGTLYSRIPYFSETAIPHLTTAILQNMDEETFRARAYSWRGREVISRNLALAEEEKR